MIPQECCTHPRTAMSEGWSRRLNLAGLSDVIAVRYCLDCGASLTDFAAIEDELLAAKA